MDPRNNAVCGDAAQLAIPQENSAWARSSVVLSPRTQAMAAVAFQPQAAASSTSASSTGEPVLDSLLQQLAPEARQTYWQALARFLRFETSKAEFEESVAAALGDKRALHNTFVCALLRGALAAPGSGSGHLSQLTMPDGFPVPSMDAVEPASLPQHVERAVPPPEHRRSPPPPWPPRAVGPWPRAALRVWEVRPSCAGSAVAALPSQSRRGYLPQAARAALARRSRATPGRAGRAGHADSWPVAGGGGRRRRWRRRWRRWRRRRDEAITEDQDGLDGQLRGRLGGAADDCRPRGARRTGVGAGA